MRVNGDDRYAIWDAAYVLGSLSAADRGEFETHLTQCPACRQAIDDVAGIPALLAEFDFRTSAAINESRHPSAKPPASPQLPSVLGVTRGRRNRSRLTAWTAVAASVFLAVAVLLGIHGYFAYSSPPKMTASNLPMSQVGTTLLTSRVWVTPERWGTLITMRSDCLAPLDAPHDRLAMVVVGRDGRQTQLGTWVAEPGHTATPTGSVATPATEIAAVQIVAADSGKVLLERSL
ncbi:zf-HC2 domain-containing protein [Mycobacterium asiaticum]|uniref:Putative zinc-finger domain-containing protein n=1 Tax=Mycobacterium asiaticum TaxID=1790 RepID=A0A1A3KV49_MYCAS|nr:zf-HC2 domain-containing protein [Mycobacterium asiaticum]OBJ87801.1 hypothetical protein A5640_05975 [Mycobacterium asiaticum]